MTEAKFDHSLLLCRTLQTAPGLLHLQGIHTRTFSQAGEVLDFWNAKWAPSRNSCAQTVASNMAKMNHTQTFKEAHYSNSDEEIPL
jgi:hypothetical protein